MRWQGRKGSQNIEDRRGGRGRKVGAGLGFGSIIIIIIAFTIISYYFVNIVFRISMFIFRCLLFSKWI